MKLHQANLPSPPAPTTFGLMGAVADPPPSPRRTPSPSTDPLHESLVEYGPAPRPRSVTFDAAVDEDELEGDYLL